MSVSACRGNYLRFVRAVELSSIGRMGLAPLLRAALQVM
jgi:hypothetical protein